MKKSIAAFLLFSAFQVNSQEVLQTEIPAPPAAAGEETRLKPVAKEWALTFGLTGLINNLQLEGSGSITGHPIIFVKRYIKDDLALRLGFGLNTVRNTTIIKDSLPQLSAFSEFDSVYKRNDISFTGGIEKHLGRHRRIDPYFGGELMLQFLGKQTSSWNQVITETAGKTTVEGEYKTDGGLGAGIFGILGFNYFIADHISLGAEYSFGYANIKTGGNFSESVITTPSSGSATSSFRKGSLENRSTGFGVNSTANIIFSVFF